MPLSFVGCVLKHVTSMARTCSPCLNIPDIGRFVVQDTLTEVMPDWTPYRFAFNNPIYFSDPTGLSEEGGNAIAYCPTCPKTDKFKPYIDDKNNVYVYAPTTDTASLKVTSDGADL